MTDFAERLRDFLDEVLILPQRIRLDTPGVEATVPMLRGVWGAALRELAPDVYRRVFDPRAASGADPRWTAAGYVLRPAPPDPCLAPAMDWLLIGPAIRHEPVLRRAWDVASGMGLGKERRRFRLCEAFALRPDGELSRDFAPWAISLAAWPLGAPAESTPCRLRFPAPLRILYRKRLVQRPQLPDIVAAALRRVGAYLPEARRAAWNELGRQAMQHARQIRCTPWQGDRLDLHRYSARQQCELDLHGVAGRFDLPDGPGPLWPLLLAAHWLHLGKATVMGLGETRIEPIGAGP